MEAFLLILSIIGFLWLISKSGRSRSRKRGPKTDHRSKARHTQSAGDLDETSAARRATANARKRVTNGVQHDPPPSIPASRKIIGRAWIIDGDTLLVNQIKIRLAGIDAPELDEPWGRKSKWAMVNLCKGKTIHVDLTGETSYDRLVGTCYLADGTDIGAELVKKGLALDGSYYSQGKYIHLEPGGARQRLARYGLKQKWK